jgi:hypothetical protein
MVRSGTSSRRTLTWHYQLRNWLITVLLAVVDCCGRGTGRGTTGGEIPVQSELQVRSAVSSVQVMESVQGSMPLVMRRWPVSCALVPPYTGILRPLLVVAGFMSRPMCVSTVSRSFRSPVDLGRPQPVPLRPSGTEGTAVRYAFVGTGSVP